LVSNRNIINNQLKRTIKDSLIYLPAKLVPAIIGILLIRILTTIFTPEEYGYYQITLSTFGLIKVFSMVWLSTSVTRFYLNYKNEHKEGMFFSTIFISTIVGALVVALLSYLINIIIFKNNIDPALFSLINLAIAASIFTAFFEIFVVVFRAGLEPKKYTTFWLLFVVGKPLLGILLIVVFGFKVNGIFWGFLIIPTILDIIIFIKLDIQKYLKISNISSSLFKQFFKYGIPISFSFLAFWILSLSDRYLIEFFRDSAEVGLYSVSYVISEKTLNFIYMILMLAAYPIIIDNWEKHGDEHTQTLITELSRYYLFLCVPILTVLVTIPKQVLLIFSSAKFIDGAVVLPLIASGIFLYGLTQYVQKGFELHKKSYKIAMLSLIAGITNISFNLILIPKFGYLGAGVSATLAYAVYFFVAIFLARKEMPWLPPYKSIFNTIIAGSLFSLFLIFGSSITPNLFIIAFLFIPLGVILFFLILILLKEINKAEINKGRDFLTSLMNINK